MIPRFPTFSIHFSNFFYPFSQRFLRFCHPFSARVLQVDGWGLGPRSIDPPWSCRPRWHAAWHAPLKHSMLATGANLLCMYMIVYVHIWLVVDLALWKILISQLGWWHSQYILYYPQKLKKSSKPPTRYRHMCIYIYIHSCMHMKSSRLWYQNISITSWLPKRWIEIWGFSIWWS